MRKILIQCLSVVSLLVAVSLPVAAAQIVWTPFIGAWVPDATSGSVAYKSGSIDITVTGNSIDTLGEVVKPFATTSTNYENIDTATHNALLISPDNPATPWLIEFDFNGTTASSGDVFTAGQLFASSFVNSTFTELTIQMFAPDDTTPINLNTLDFEQHALISPNFDALLDWNPATGLLQPVREATSKNSGWGFFSPTSTEIGKIVITATSMVGPDAINFSFGMPVVVPVPAAIWLFGSGLLGLMGVARRSEKAGREMS